jgi:diguanylate cyclase (GGDEF)-like protein
LPPSSILGKTLQEIFPNLPPDQLAHFVQDNLEVMQSGNPKRGYIEAFPTNKGRKWVQTDRMPFRDDKGSINGLVCLAIDITNIRETEEKLWYLSFHDVLTGLYNKAYFEEELLKLDGSRQLPVSIVLAKIENYETVNRTKGSEPANELLKRTASILKVFRTEDVVARVADDKFVGLLPQAPAEIAAAVIERMQKTLENDNKQNDIPLELKFSVLTKEKGSSLSGILKEAEELF